MTTGRGQAKVSVVTRRGSGLLMGRKKRGRKMRGPLYCRARGRRGGPMQVPGHFRRRGPQEKIGRAVGEGHFIKRRGVVVGRAEIRGQTALRQMDSPSIGRAMTGGGRRLLRRKAG